MNQHDQTILTIPTTGKCFHNITAKVESIVAQSGLELGLCTLFIRHTSASLIIQENADPDVLQDLNTFFAKLVPEDGRSYLHRTEGPDDMPAHIRSVLTQTSLQIPFSGGRLVLGTWQGIYLWEHRQQRHQRQIVVHLHGV